MLTGFRVLWRGLLHFWDESLLMLRVNLTWFVVSLPLYLLTALICGIFLPAVEPETGENIWPWVMAAFVLVMIPGPTSAGVYAVANHVANEETPEFSLFWQAIKLLWKKSLAIYLIGAGVLGGLIFNTSFYTQVSGLLQAVAILWLYGIIYWLSLQAYLMPLLVAAAIPPPPQLSGDDGWPIDESRPKAAPPPPPEPEFLPLPILYKRAAILALANPLMSLVMLFGALLALALSSFALPVYPLIVMSLVALINCRGLRALREKYFPPGQTCEHDWVRTSERIGSQPMTFYDKCRKCGEARSGASGNVG